MMFTEHELATIYHYINRARIIAEHSERHVTSDATRAELNRIEERVQQERRALREAS